MPFVVVRKLDSADVPAVRDLVDTVTIAQGHPPIDQERLSQALDGRAQGYLAALAWDPAHTTLVGYVQAVRSDAWDIELAMASSGLKRPMLQAIRDAVAADDAGLRLWIYQATDGDDRLAASVGLLPVREIRQLRRPLTIASGEAVGSPALSTRPFVVGQDEQAWLEVNNRAFAWHPEQGAWTLATLRAREREPWFDPDGFRLHEVDGKLAGFCWTKIHPDTRPPLGEIYVVGVDPAFHRRGLGRALVLAGLDHLARTGLTTGMLYVDATNSPAIQMYADLGFRVHHVDRVYG